jgi:hypothetical protein
MAFTPITNLPCGVVGLTALPAAPPAVFWHEVKTTNAVNSISGKTISPLEFFTIFLLIKTK